MEENQILGGDTDLRVNIYWAVSESAGAEKSKTLPPCPSAIMGAMSDDDSATIRVHVRVDGLVQGVGYRYFAYLAARELGLTGWVRNLRDGGVETEAQGVARDVEAFVTRLHVGPRYSRVESVETSRIALVGDVDFRVIG